MARYTTITEIAKRLGISHSTVSRALNDHPRISEATKQKVQELAKQLGYQRNTSAHAFNKGQSKMIGIIVPDLSTHFFAKVVRGVQSVLSQQGYCMLLFDTSESMQRESEAIASCIAHRVDGVLAAISMETNAFEHFQQLSQHEVPLVFYDRVANFLPVPKVISNDYQAAFDATNHLIDRGCKNIAHITASINLNNSNNRLYGYMDALSAANLEVQEDMIHYYRMQPESIDLFIESLLHKHPEVDGIFVFNDYSANYTVNVLRQHGKQVPEDIAVMGFSDEPVATHMTPQLSTMKQAGEKMGQLAAQKILSIIQNEEPMVDEKIIINPELIVRAST